MPLLRRTRHVYLVGYAYTNGAVPTVSRREITVPADVASIEDVEEIEQKLYETLRDAAVDPATIGPVTVVGVSPLRRE